MDYQEAATPKPTVGLSSLRKAENMSDWRKLTAIGLVVGLTQLSLADLAMPQEAASPPNPTLTRQQVDQLGVGARVKVQFADGKKLGGSIAAIEEGAFLLASGRENSPRRVAYDQVAQLRLAKLTYRASGQVDPAEAKRVVAGLGVDKHIMVKTAAGQEFHGNIQAIEPDQFIMLPDHQTAAVQIAYRDVRQLGPNLSTGMKIAIGVAVGIAVTGIIVIIALTHGGC
jgi:ribosome maturation factor RimP